MLLTSITLDDRSEPLLLPWPSPGNPGGFLTFTEPSDWRAFVGSLGINPCIPDIIQTKFNRAQTLYLLGWIDFGLIKVGELAALIALELSVMDRYGGMLPKKRRSFAALLRHMVEQDGLTDAQIPMIAKCSGTAIGQLIGETKPTLAERRNKLAHGDPFDGMATSGLLELARDLIDYAYRGYIAQAAQSGIRQ